ncbi:MAG: hypothetical protein WCN27_03075 [Alphaproteobacteria bacterium]
MCKSEAIVCKSEAIVCNSEAIRVKSDRFSREKPLLLTRIVLILAINLSL